MGVYLKNIDQIINKIFSLFIMPRLIGVSMQNRKENNRNIKRAGCVSSVGRPVMIVANKRCCCKTEVWCPLGNNKFKLSKPADCVPTLSSVNIVSDNVTTTLAVVGDTVTVTFTASVTITTPIVTFSCHDTDIISSRVTTINTSGNTWTASYDTANGDGDGAVTYSIAFSDSAGNAGVAGTSGTGSVTFDKTSDKATMTYAFSDGATFMQGITVTMTATFPTALSVVPQLALTGVDPLPAGDMTVVVGNNKAYTRTYTIGNYDGDQIVALSVGKDLAGNDIVTAPTNKTFTLVGEEPTQGDVDAVLTANFVAVAGQSVTLSAAPAAGNTAYLAPINTTTQYGAPTTNDSTITAAVIDASATIVAPTDTGNYNVYLVDGDSNLSVESAATVETVQNVNDIVPTPYPVYYTALATTPPTPLGLPKRVPQGHKLFLSAAGQTAATGPLTNSTSTTSTSAGSDSILAPTQPSSGSHYKFYLTDMADNIVERNVVTESTNFIQVV